MDSPFLHPSFIVPLAVGLVTFIGWLIRLESKVNTNEKNILKIETELTKIALAFDAHRENQGIHFNSRIAETVDKANEHRFATIERQLGEINRKLDHMADRE